MLELLDAFQQLSGMTSKALTKEQKRVESGKRTKLRQRYEESNTMDRLVISGTTFLGTAGVAVSDAYTEDGGARSWGPVPVGVIGGGILTAVGLALGKGALAAAVAGTGLGATNASAYRALHDAVRKAREEKEA